MILKRVVIQRLVIQKLISTPLIPKVIHRQIIFIMGALINDWFNLNEGLLAV